MFASHSHTQLWCAGCIWNLQNTVLLQKSSSAFPVLRRAHCESSSFESKGILKKVTWVVSDMERVKGQVVILSKGSK